MASYLPRVRKLEGETGRLSDEVETNRRKASQTAIDVDLLKGRLYMLEHTVQRQFALIFAILLVMGLVHCG